MIANTYQMSAPLPFVTGSEFAGEVSEIGDGVAGLTVGQRVFGSCFVGAFADEVVVGTGALTAIPDGVGRPRGGGLRRSPTRRRTTCCAPWRPCSRRKS